jgi:hypothetical protein
MQFLRLGVPDYGKKITSNTVSGWLNQSQNRIRSNGSINRIPPLFKNIKRYLGGKWLTCAGHPVLGNYFRTRGKTLAG